MTYASPVIDCDVHHVLGAQQRLYEYLPRGWRDHLEGNSQGLMPVMTRTPFATPYQATVRQGESFESLAGDADALCAEIFSDGRVERAVLTYSDLRGLNGLRSPYYAAEVAQAANRWTTDEWLEKDPRLFGSVIVATHLPEVAAKEIARAGQHPQMVQVILTASAMHATYGHPVYEPIFKAADDLGLPVAICDGTVGEHTPPAGSGGMLSYWAEYNVLRAQTHMTHVVSVLSSGTLDRFPNVRLVLLGGGLGWIPGLMWRFDADYRGCRSEVPWLKEMPSETFARRVRVTSNPLDPAPDRAAMRELLACFEDPAAVLVYSSGFPYGTTESVDDIEQLLDADLLARVCHENARELYGWPHGSSAPSIPASEHRSMA
jgi:predicted TIM-barrel fold metal-dependent hydrolase